MPTVATESRAITFDKRVRVLLADDTETVRELTSHLLERMGCNVDAAEDGDQALALARQFRYDLILLDLDMPLMDGTAAARAIRSRPSNRSTLIVAISAYLGAVGDPSDRWRVFDGELSKPISIDRLRQIICALSPIHAGELGPEPDAGRFGSVQRRRRSRQIRRTYE